MNRGKRDEALEPVREILVVHCNKEFCVTVRELTAYVLLFVLVLAITGGYAWWRRDQRRRYPWKFRGR